MKKLGLAWRSDKKREIAAQKKEKIYIEQDDEVEEVKRSRAERPKSLIHIRLDYETPPAKLYDQIKDDELPVHGSWGFAPIEVCIFSTQISA